MESYFATNKDKITSDWSKAKVKNKFMLIVM